MDMLTFKLIDCNIFFKGLRLAEIPGITEPTEYKMRNIGICTPSSLLSEYLCRTNIITIQPEPLCNFNKLLAEIPMKTRAIKNCVKAMEHMCKFISEWANKYKNLECEIKYVPGTDYLWRYALVSEYGIFSFNELKKIYTDAKNPANFIKQLSRLSRCNTIVLAYVMIKMQEQLKLPDYTHANLFQKILLKRNKQKKDNVKHEALITLWTHMKTQGVTHFNPWDNQYTKHYDNTKEMQALQTSIESLTETIAQLNVESQCLQSEINILTQNITSIDVKREKYKSYEFKIELDKIQKQIDGFGAKINALQQHKLYVVNRNSIQTEIYGKECVYNKELSKIDTEIYGVEQSKISCARLYDEKYGLTQINYEAQIQNVRNQIHKLEITKENIQNKHCEFSEKLKIINGYLLRQTKRSDYEKYMTYYNIECDVTNIDSLIYSCNVHRQDFILKFGAHGMTTGHLAMTYCSGNENPHLDTLYISDIMCEGFWTTNTKCGCGNQFKWNQDGCDPCDVTKFTILSNMPYGKVESW